ncbi:MAG: hypothetical protein CMK71_04690, partial [Pseudomonadaceae bacterium]|nr:hypothetical protein [Pseudomonadaceae bacterium]
PGDQHKSERAGSAATSDSSKHRGSAIRGDEATNTVNQEQQRAKVEHFEFGFDHDLLACWRYL